MKKINIYSFVFSIICIMLFFASFIFDSFILDVHPLQLLLYLTIITFFFGLIGFSGVEDWKGMMRSVVTVLLTLGLCGCLAFVLIVGGLLG